MWIMPGDRSAMALPEMASLPDRGQRAVHAGMQQSLGTMSMPLLSEPSLRGAAVFGLSGLVSSFPTSQLFYRERRQDSVRRRQ